MRSVVRLTRPPRSARSAANLEPLLGAERPPSAGDTTDHRTVIHISARLISAAVYLADSPRLAARRPPGDPHSTRKVAMSDEEQVTLDNENSADQSQDNWEQRAKEQQAGFTKSQQELAAERAIWEDEEAALARFREKFPHRIVESDEESDEDEPDLDEDDQPMTVGQWKAHLREQAEKEHVQSEQQRFENDLKAAINGRDLDQWGERAVRFAAASGEIKGPDDLKKQVDEYLERQAPAKTKPRVPHVPTNGAAATDVPNWDGMTQGEINQYMAERVRANQAQT
jgi:hypothetical protein